MIVLLWALFKYGHSGLGKDEQEPKCSTATRFSMLFCDDGATGLQVLQREGPGRRDVEYGSRRAGADLVPLASRIPAHRRWPLGHMNSNDKQYKDYDEL